MSDTITHDKPPAKRPFQFTLRSLLVVTTLVALVLGLIAWLGYGGVVLSLFMLTVVSALCRVWRTTKTLAALTVLAFLPALLPLFVDSPEGVLRMMCSNNLKQLGRALRQYHDVYGSFPPAYVADKNGRPIHSWRVLILPYLDQENLYKQYRFDEPWDGPNNRKLASAMPEVYRCPTTPAHLHPGETSYVAVVGPETAWRGDQSANDSDIHDGLSMTILLVEMKNSGIPWMQPHDPPYPPMPAKVNPRSDRGASSYHPNGANVLFADGHVMFLSDDSEQLGPLLTIDGGETIEEGNY